MITSFILFTLYGVLFLITSPLRLFPDVTMPSWISSTISTANGYMSMGYSWLPHLIAAFLLTWGLFLFIEGAIFAYKGFMWIIKKIPGIN